MKSRNPSHYTNLVWLAFNSHTAGWSVDFIRNTDLWDIWILPSCTSSKDVREEDLEPCNVRAFHVKWVHLRVDSVGTWVCSHQNSQHLTLAGAGLASCRIQIYMYGLDHADHNLFFLFSYERSIFSGLKFSTWKRTPQDLKSLKTE